MTVRNRNTSLRALRTFCIAAKKESFRDAAEELFITASAVSHQVKSLEQEIGQKLFDRDSRSLTLTDTGMSLYKDLSPLILQIDEITSQHMNSTARSSLRISVQPFFASEMFAPNLHKFSAAHPEIDITVDTSDESIERHPANADASIRVFKSPPANLSSDRLSSLRLVPVASPEFRDTLKVKARKIVSDFPYIVHNKRPQAWNQWERSADIELPKKATSVRLGSMIAAARAAERGIGAALLPTQLSTAWFESGTLVPLFKHELVTNEDFYFACAHQNAGERNVHLLRQWVLQNFTEST